VPRCRAGIICDSRSGHLHVRVASIKLARRQRSVIVVSDGTHCRLIQVLGATDVNVDGAVERRARGASLPLTLLPLAAEPA
jgi:hypothetical protein